MAALAAAAVNSSMKLDALTLVAAAEANEAGMDTETGAGGCMAAAGVSKPCRISLSVP